MQSVHQSLTLQGYQQALCLPHADMIPFVRKWTRKRTVYSMMYWGITFLCGIITMMYYYASGLEAMDALVYFFMSFIGAFCLVPLHEYLHVRAYRYVGATHTSYDVHWKQLMFVALADGFVANYKHFRIVALTPAIGISAALLVVTWLIGPVAAFVCWCILFWHFSMCGGDFALMSYMHHMRKQGIVTFDDVAEKTSYFYIKP